VFIGGKKNTQIKHIKTHAANSSVFEQTKLSELGLRTQFRPHIGTVRTLFHVNRKFDDKNSRKKRFSAIYFFLILRFLAVILHCLNY
jgi:preprotein translocase subunit Sec63